VIRLLADENFNADVVRGLVRRVPEIDLVRAQDVGLGGVDDVVLLDWAAGEDRIVLTHDLATLVGAAYERTRSGVHMAGVIAVPQWLAVGAAIEDLHLVATCSIADEWSDQVAYLPLR
jgi:hypothetical protein